MTFGFAHIIRRNMQITLELSCIF